MTMPCPSSMDLAPGVPPLQPPHKHSHTAQPQLTAVYLEPLGRVGGGGVKC